MEATVRPFAWKTLLAFGIIYFVWGSTFLAIRVGVRQVRRLRLPACGFVAGAVLFGWISLSGTPCSSRREWLAASLSRFGIFVLDYGLLFGPNDACLRELRP